VIFSTAWAARLPLDLDQPDGVTQRTECTGGEID
jgi:hypothetical protein